MTEFWPWWWGGLAIGTIATLYPLLSGRLLGVSSIYAALFTKRENDSLSELEAALLAETEAEFGPAEETSPRRSFTETLASWRLSAERFRPWFLVGIAIGSGLISYHQGDFQLSLSLGQRFDLRYGDFGVLPVVVLLSSGVMIGFGTRLGGGCTSGHGISGLARAQPGSALTTCVFWTTALAVAWAFLLL